MLSDTLAMLFDAMLCYMTLCYAIRSCAMLSDPICSMAALAAVVSGHISMLRGRLESGVGMQCGAVILIVMGWR